MSASANPLSQNPLFSLGNVNISRGVLLTVPPPARQTALARHAHGDWGESGEDLCHANAAALRTEGCVRSVYHSADGVMFWIVTLLANEETLIALPEDFLAHHRASAG